MGRTCWQSGSLSRAVLIQFTKANRSSSVIMSIYRHQLKLKHKHSKVTEWLIRIHFSGSHCPLQVSLMISGAYVAKAQSVNSLRQPSTGTGESKETSVLPENECCVPSLDSSDVPPIARMPSFLLMTLRKVFATSLPLSSLRI